MSDQMTGLDRIQDRSFGGADVATRPDRDDEGWWPTGRMHLGMEEFIQRTIDATKNPRGLRVFLLLGGAGNGKSFAARRVLATLQEPKEGLPKKSAWAQRSYHITLPGVDAIVLNDATIASSEEYSDGGSIALATDLDNWVNESTKKPIVVFGCVNRGIIIDELHSVESRGVALGAGKSILERLAGTLGDNAKRGRETEASTTGGIYDSFDLNDRDVRIETLAVDSTSIVQPTPRNVSLEDLRGRSGPDRGRFGLGENSSGEELLSNLLALLAEEAARREAECPIRANLGSLAKRPALLVKRLADAEVSGGRVLSYRDFWGAVVLGILGPKRVTTESSANTVWISRRLQEARGERDCERRARCLAELSMHRTHQALYQGAGLFRDHASDSSAPGFPLAPAFRKIDPIFMEGRLASSVDVAMELMTVNGSPSKYLLEAYPELKNDWSSFDETLEASIIEFVSSKKNGDSSARRAIAWYSEYLMRFAAFYTGTGGQSKVVTELRGMLSAQTARLPEELRRSLSAYLFPRMSGASNQHTTFVPFLSVTSTPVRASETLPINSLLDAYDYSAIALTVDVRSGRVFLEAILSGSNEVLASTTLDFELLREAIAVGQSGRGGTEASDYIDARIERFRSSVFARIASGNPYFVRRVLASRGELTELM